MGETSVTIGRILTYHKEQHLKNLDVVSKLVSESEGYSMFTKEMFCQNTIVGKGSYVLGFARSYKNIESQWGNWIEKFEEILKLMKWDSVNVFLETEFFGTHQYMWMSKYHNRNEKIKRENNYELLEKENWYFGKGHRNFFGMASNYGWEREIEEIRTLYYLATSIDKTLEGKVTRMKMFKRGEDEFELLSGANGLKAFISKLIKLYIMEKQKYNSNYSQFKFDKIEPLLHEDSPTTISQLKIASSLNNTEWIYHFTDKMNTEEK